MGFELPSPPVGACSLLKRLAGSCSISLRMAQPRLQLRLAACSRAAGVGTAGTNSLPGSRLWHAALVTHCCPEPWRLRGELVGGERAASALLTLQRAGLSHQVSQEAGGDLLGFPKPGRDERRGGAALQLPADPEEADSERRLRGKGASPAAPAGQIWRFRGRGLCSNPCRAVLQDFPCRIFPMAARGWLCFPFSAAACHLSSIPASLSAPAAPNHAAPSALTPLSS